MVNKKEKKIYSESDLSRVQKEHDSVINNLLLKSIEYILSKNCLSKGEKKELLEIEGKIKINKIDDPLNSLIRILKCNERTVEIKSEDIGAVEKNFISEYSYYSDIISGLLSSIKNNVELTASPLSGKIYDLKMENSKFLKSFSTLKDEINNEKSNLNYNRVVSSFKNQTDKFQVFGEHIEKDFNYTTSSLNKVEEMFNVISDITKNIEDIASNIKTLSINASIEAARAGDHGKGFKVIALGTKDLSDQTNKLLENIVTAVEETKKIIFETITTVERQREYVHTNRDDQQNGYETFYNILVEFYKRFEDVFNDVTQGTKEANKHIDGVAPMIQLHDALIQEVDNISKMLIKLNNSYNDEINKILSSLEKDELNKLLNKIITEFEKQITTDGEVEVLGNFTEKHKIFRERRIEKVDKDIEFF